METTERLKHTATLAKQRFYNAKSNSIDISTGTVDGRDGATGRTFVVAADGIVRTNSIASSSQLGVTSSFVAGSDGNAGFSDGLTAN